MSLPVKIFDVAYYINLAYRTDRKISFERMSAFLPTKEVIRFEAINGKEMTLGNWPGNPGSLGIRESHIRVLEWARQEQRQFFFVFEDDAVIPKTFSKKFGVLLDEVGDDWDMIYLYAKNHFIKPIKLGNGVMQLQNTLGLVGVAYNSRNLDKIIHKLKNDLRWVDSSMADLHQVLKVYAPVKSIISHLKGYSDNVEDIVKTEKNLFEIFWDQMNQKARGIIRKMIK